MSQGLLHYAEALSKVVRILATQWQTCTPGSPIPIQPLRDLIQQAMHGLSNPMCILDPKELVQAMGLFYASEWAIRLLSAHPYPGCDTMLLTPMDELLDHICDVLFALRIRFRGQDMRYRSYIEQMAIIQCKLVDEAEIPDDRKLLLYNELLHDLLDGMAYALRMGLFQHRHLDAVTLLKIYNLHQTHMGNCSNARPFVPLNACLPEPLDRIQGGTLYEKLDRLIADTRHLPEYEDVRKEFEAVLLQMEQQQHALHRSMFEWATNADNQTNMAIEKCGHLDVPDEDISHIIQRGHWYIPPSSSFRSLQEYKNATYRAFEADVDAYKAEIKALQKARRREAEGKRRESKRAADALPPPERTLRRRGPP